MTTTDAINPDTGKFTHLDQEDTMTDHRAEAEMALDSVTGWGPLAHLMAAVHDTLRSSLDRISDEQAEQTATLTEIRDRLPEYVTPTLDWLDEPAPADDGLAEWERELLRPATCCGKCPPIAGGGYDCTCEGNPRCEKAGTPEERVIRDDHGGIITRTAPADVEDERIGAWHRVAGHPFFRGCYAQERPLIDSMLDSLTLAEAELADMTRERDKYATQAEKWEARHAALRAYVEGVEAHFAEHPTTGVNPHHVARRIKWLVLDHDNEWGEQG